MKYFLPTLTLTVIFVGAGCASSQPIVINSSASGAVPVAPTAQVVPVAPTAPSPAPTKPMSLTYPGILSSAEVDNTQIRIKTAKGDIVFDVLPKEGPRAASNFVYLAKNKFYDGLTFHRVVPGFVIQGGDPLGNGTGGPGYKFADDNVSLPYNAGIVAMANSGPNTNGSQFFIMLENNSLPPQYSVFGRVTSGMEVVAAIAVGDVMTSVAVETK